MIANKIDVDLAADCQNPPTLTKSILFAALALNGVAILPSTAQAEDVPEKASISWNNLHYRESQPGLDRVGVNSNSFLITAPVAGVWSFDATLVTEKVSGASPRYHTVISSASKMSDLRKAGDLKIRRYFDRLTLSAGIATSSENDYESKAGSLEAKLFSDDNNTTWNVGLGAASDKITAVGRNVHETRRGKDFLVGVSQVLSAQDIAQLTLTYQSGTGYFSDPYKSLDIRPRERKQTALLARHNHYFPDADSTLRLSYRYYSDSFKIRSHTLTVDYAQTLPEGWTLTPTVRLYTQKAASFYFEPSYVFLYIPVGYKIGGTQFVTEDQRLSAFGSRSLALKLSKKFNENWMFDLKLERYQQRNDGEGKFKLADLNASTLQVGVSYSF